MHLHVLILNVYCNLLSCFVYNVHVLYSSRKVSPVKPAPPPVVRVPKKGAHTTALI